MSKDTPLIQDGDVTTPEAPHERLRVFDYLWPDPPSPTPASAPYAPERRAAARYNPAALILPGRVRVHPGIDVQLVDVSLRGALIEASTRFSPGTPLRLILLTTDFEEVAADGLVLRCSLHSILADHVLFRIAVRFFTTVPIGDLVA